MIRARSLALAAALAAALVVAAPTSARAESSLELAGRPELRGVELAPGTSRFARARSAGAERMGRVALRGAIRYRGGAPVAGVTGRIAPIGRRAYRGAFIVTDHAGRFDERGMAPGRYYLYLDLEGAPVIRFEIPDDAGRIHELGARHLRRSGRAR